ncbi:group XIIA secretory phospholipase A2-like [Chaetodon trifascialis]|uniref:group XIIA secretory phospholipase A2-like n=1 Tax=Chaetodon trifascialis TaxID=109706 RepID=UPI0039941AE4
MNRISSVCVLLLGLSSYVSACENEADTAHWSATLKTIRDGIKTIDTFWDAAQSFLDSDGGLCRYRCDEGDKLVPRPGYEQPPPNGCSSALFGFQFDVGVPSLNKCCNQHDSCYDTCGREKHDCDREFRHCLETICRNVQKALGLDHSVQACDSTVTLLYKAAKHLGCKPYLDSQSESCVCQHEEKQEL